MRDNAQINIHYSRNHVNNQKRFSRISVIRYPALPRNDP